MSLATLERAILDELREITKRPKLAIKDILEWSTSEDEVRKHARSGEAVIHCPKHGVWVAIPEATANPRRRGDAKPL